MAGWEALEQSGLFVFVDALAAVNDLLQPPQDPTPSPRLLELTSGVNLDLTHDLTVLGAAANRVLEVFTNTSWPEPLQLPVTVEARHTRAAFLSFACAATFIHGRTEGGEIPLSEVIAFPGDARRLDYLGAQSATQYFESFGEFSDRLTALYASSGSSYSRAVAETGWLEVNRAIWLATYLRFADPTSANDLVLDFINNSPTLRRGLNG